MITRYPPINDLNRVGGAPAKANAWLHQWKDHPFIITVFDN
jgi:hypothetical protein